MQPPHLRSLAAAAVTVAVLGACSDLAAPLPLDADRDRTARTELESESNVELTSHYMILGQGGRLPAGLEAAVQAAGGRVSSTIPEIGVAFVEPLVEDFQARAAGIRGVESMTYDLRMELAPATVTGRALGPVDHFAAVLSGAGSEASLVGSLGDGEPFYSFQWAPSAIQLPEAWNAGYTGRGVRVAIVDGAIFDQHLDLAPNLDVAASRSFVPGFAYNQDTGTFWHGTHVAGIVGAARNGIGTIGVAPDATLIGVKVLHSGVGAFEWILNGLVYAARPLSEGGAGAQVINMSLGATIDYRTNWHDKDFRDAFRALQTAYDRATRYAYQQGAAVISSAGNGATNFDDASHLFKFPAQNQHVIAISATGPHGWALSATDFHRPAYYSDYGRSLVYFAAPGGTIGLWLVDGYDGICTMHGTFVSLTRFCEDFDQILSTVRGTSNASYNWTQGTSMAAPMVSGIAALIIERRGGSANVAQIRSALTRGAVDHGAPGRDAFYGHGFVNAWRSIR